MEKQTPRVANLPAWQGNPRSWAIAMLKALKELFNKIRNDLDNGTMNFPTVDIAGIGNADVNDFDEGQLRIYRDTNDSNKIYLVVRRDTTLYRTTDAMTSI